MVLSVQRIYNAVKYNRVMVWSAQRIYNAVKYNRVMVLSVQRIYNAVKYYECHEFRECLMKLINVECVLNKRSKNSSVDITTSIVVVKL